MGPSVIFIKIYPFFFFVEKSAVSAKRLRFSSKLFLNLHNFYKTKCSINFL